MVLIHAVVGSTPTFPSKLKHINLEEEIMGLILLIAQAYYYYGVVCGQVVGIAAMSKMITGA